jgi:hypothetical protein
MDMLFRLLCQTFSDKQKFLDTDTWLPLLQVVALDPEIKNNMGNHCRLAFGIANRLVLKSNNPPLNIFQKAKYAMSSLKTYNIGF